MKEIDSIIIKTILELIKSTPNDTEFGAAVRELLIKEPNAIY